jgi:hypothetical protein
MARTKNRRRQRSVQIGQSISSRKALCILIGVGTALAISLLDYLLLGKLPDLAVVLALVVVVSHCQLMHRLWHLIERSIDDGVRRPATSRASLVSLIRRKWRDLARRFMAGGDSSAPPRT